MTLYFTNTHSLLRTLFVLVALFWLFVARPAIVNAATIIVDDDCSFVNAIRSANGGSQLGDMNNCEIGDSGADTVSLGRDVILHEALPDVHGVLTLEGNHHSLSRAADAGDLRLLWVEQSGDLTINNLTLLNGRLSGNSVNDYGGAIALENGAVLTVNNSMFRDNYAEYGGGAIGGIGLKATIRNSLFINNSASNAEGAGGALFTEGGAVSVANSSFHSNSALAGGAISAQFGSKLEINRSEFLDNSASYNGGAIIVDGNLNIRASSFVGNRAETYGGAAFTRGSVVIENSTFYGNALGRVDGFGAALDIYAAIATLRHVTIANSYAPLLVNYNSQLYMVNSVAAGGQGRHCLVTDGSRIERNINNWLEYRSCDSDHWGELELTTPRGSPAVVPLYVNSYLIDRAPADAHCLDTDQRGMRRPAGNGCDIGAFEGSIPEADAQPAVDESSEDAINRIVCDASLSGSVTVEGTAPGAQCQDLSADVGENPDVIAAVEVGGYIGAGVTVCFDGDGRVVGLESDTLSLTVRGFASATTDGRNCVFLDQAVSIALVRSDSEAAGNAVRELADCAVTTSHGLNLRIGRDATITDLVPAGETLFALARNDHWFQVEYEGQLGWISSQYVEEAGDCG